MIKLLKKQYRHYHLILLGVLFLIFLMRFPSLFEPFWYGDEGIFGAVARNLNLGGTLYQTAWDNKPPMIFLTYASIFTVFGVSMFWLRLVAIIAVLASAAVIYEIAESTIGARRAIIAAAIFGFLTSLRLIEGNLALTEIFMILPISLAFMVAIKRNFDLKSLFFAGALIAIGSLYKQVGALEAAALGIFLFFVSDNLLEFIKKGFVLSVGFTLPYLIDVLYFAPKGLLDDNLFAAYTYYQIYFEESPQRALLINFLKFSPIVAAIFYGFWKKYKKQKIEVFHLFFLWTAFSYLGSFFSGRTYGHYLIQAAPATSLLLASINIKPKINIARVVFVVSFFVPLVLLVKILFADFITAGSLNQFAYWQNFLEFAQGKKSVSAYNNYFDWNVNRVTAVANFIESADAKGEVAYIWGDLPWLYAIGDLRNPVRYVTSFHVFGVPTGREEVIDSLFSNPPVYIFMPPDSNGYFDELEKFRTTNYSLIAEIEEVEIWQRDY